MPQQVTRRAYAKVNLALAVGPPLPRGHPKAGFHPIVSWMSCIDLFDELHLTALDAGQESRYTIRWAADAPRPSPIDWPLEKDLAVRAHRLLERHSGRLLPVAMEVLKRIPVGGGLGGGSSDGAAALLAVDELFGLGLGGAALSSLGAALGSDVPFFIDDADPARPAIVTGLGESVRRLTPVPSGLVLVVPPFGCVTSRVYQAFDAHPTRVVDHVRIEDATGKATVSGVIDPGLLSNDLRDAAIAIEGRLGALSTHLARLGAAPLLSGSGSGLFVLCREGEQMQRAEHLRATLAELARACGEDWPNHVRVVECRLV